MSSFMITMWAAFEATLTYIVHIFIMTLIVGLLKASCRECMVHTMALYAVAIMENPTMHSYTCKPHMLEFMSYCKNICITQEVMRYIHVA